MDEYNIDLLLKMKNTNNKYILVLQEMNTIRKNIYHNNDNNHILEQDLEKNLNELYNKLNLYKEKCTYNIPSYLIHFFNKIINDKIIECCPHEFVEDDIDISPDRSQKIYYCSICENNLDDCMKK